MRIDKINVEIEEGDLDSLDLSGLYLTKGMLGLIDQGYQGDGLETPEKIIDSISRITAEINARTKAEIQRKLKNALARRDALATVSEKRAMLDDEIASLKAKLGQ